MAVQSARAKATWRRCGSSSEVGARLCHGRLSLLHLGMVYGGAALPGVGLARRRSSAEFEMLAAVVVYFALTSAGHAGSARFRALSAPLGHVLLNFGYRRYWLRRSSADGSEIGREVAALALVAAITFAICWATGFVLPDSAQRFRIHRLSGFLPACCGEPRRRSRADRHERRSCSEVPSSLPDGRRGVAACRGRSGPDAGGLGAAHDVAIDFASAVLVFLLARLLVERRGALLSSLLCVSYPPLLYLSHLPSSEVLYIPLLLATMLAFLTFEVRSSWRIRGAVLVGALAGAASLTRSAGIGLGTVLALALILLGRAPRGQKASLASILVLANLFTVLPWEIWAHRSVGRWIPLSTSGAPSLVDGLTFGVRDSDGRRAISLHPEVESLMGDLYVEIGDVRSSRTVLRQLSREVASRPTAVMRLLALKARRSWYATDSRTLEGSILAFQILHVPALLFGAARAARRAGTARQAALLVLIIVAYTWLTTMAVLSIVRYMVPAIVLLFPLLPSLWGSMTQDGAGAIDAGV